MDINNWLAFSLMSLIITITPGPDLLYLLSKSYMSPRRNAVFSGIGVWLAAITHISAVSIGLSALIYSSQTAFLIIKYAGGFYLVYLGIRLAISKKDIIFGDNYYAQKKGFMKDVLSGYMVNITNPKAALFFISFLPSFIQAGAMSAQKQFLILGVTVIVIKITIELSMIIFSSSALGLLKQSHRAKNIINKISACCFIGFGIQILFMTRYS